MRAAWAALSLLLLPALGRRVTPAATATTATTGMATTTTGTATATTGTATTTTATTGTATATTGMATATTATTGMATATTATTGTASAGDSAGDGSGDSAEISAAFVTCPNVSVATELARALVQQRLAACVNIIPGVTSFLGFLGPGAVFGAVFGVFGVPSWALLPRSRHPYEVPEVLALPVAQGNPPYLRWVRHSVPP
uniref:protein CutA-like n=1 Tax=Lonchura striata TaxID=40157 RepID=UPI0012938910|nr:protein CutA-like [Lonchura striata domestica]